MSCFYPQFFVRSGLFDGIVYNNPMEVIKRILVPIDLAEQGQPTVESAADLAVNCGSQVTLFHVIEMVEHVSFDELRDFYEKLQAKAESILSSLEQTLQQREIPTHRAIAYGNRLDQILDYARSEEIDLILMASHAVTEDRQQPRWGSLSHRVAILAPCSVMLVR